MRFAWASIAVEACDSTRARVNREISKAMSASLIEACADED